MEVSVTHVSDVVVARACAERNVHLTSAIARGRHLVSWRAIVLHVRGAAFLSLQDPPEFAKEATAACQNVGAWPILVGEHGERDTMLAPPIILYDYPEIAPESPGDLFDGTEIDEILTLRILTLTEDEKRAVGAIDAQARALLHRSEALSPEQMLSLHGRLRPARENADE